jgi:acyl-CoA thioesterase FadM
MKPPKITSWEQGIYASQINGKASNGTTLVTVNLHTDYCTVYLFGQVIEIKDEFKNLKQVSLELLKQLFSEMEEET